MRKKKEELITTTVPDNYLHCQGCGEKHSKTDLVQVCVACVQNKFIPRDCNWCQNAFADEKSFEQWWNHIKDFNVDKLLKMIEEKKEKDRARAVFIDSLPDDESEETINAIFEFNKENR